MTNLNKITQYKLSRTHSPNTNYLIITQCEIVKFDYKNAVEYNPYHKTTRILKDYEVEAVKSDNSSISEERLLTYLEDDVMKKSNVATNEYKYFRIILSNGADIICTDYKSFIIEYELYKAKIEARNS